MVRDCAARARGQRVYAVLDSEGEPLRLGLGGEPDLVVPNQMEAEELVGFEFETVQDLVVALEQIVEMGARGVVITRDDGALAYVREAGRPRLLRATVPQLRSSRPWAPGDALLAGLLAARRAERKFADALRYAVACGAASTQHEQPGMLNPREVQRLTALVEVAELAPAQA
jgi:1-phosphofructokinase/tagatose 6-phosphate kinase